MKDAVVENQEVGRLGIQSKITTCQKGKNQGNR